MEHLPSSHADAAASRTKLSPGRTRVKKTGRVDTAISSPASLMHV
jgi:hypothetical protein